MIRRREFLAGVAGAATFAAGCIDTSDTTTETPPKSGDETVVTVAPNGDFVYDPDELTVSVGTTVRWEWDAGGHNIAVSAKPDSSDWTGDNEELYGAGYAYEHTFTVAGEYEYYCEPHQSAGMVATITVTE